MFFLVPSCPPPPLSAGAGLGDPTALLWHRTRFLSCWAVFGVVLAHFVLPTPPPLGAGGDLGILATPTVAKNSVTSCFLFFSGIYDGSRILHPHPAANGEFGNRAQCVGEG